VIGFQKIIGAFLSIIVPVINNFKKIPVWSYVVYALASALFCFLYYNKIVLPEDFSASNSIQSVGSFETAKPYQFRVLVPLFFKFILFPFYPPNKIIYIAFCFLSTILTQIFFYFLVNKFFQNTKANLILGSAIIYPMLWNFVILNQSFQYYDVFAVMFFTAGLYFVASENFFGLVIAFILGILNKEAAVYLIFCFVLFNYKNVFSKGIILKAFLLACIFLSVKISMMFLFENNPGDSFESGLPVNKEIFSNVLSNRVYQKNLFFNLGLLYFPALLLFITGKWKIYSDRKLIFMNLAVAPYIVLGIFMIYFTEVRVYTEVMVMITLLALCYLGGFKKFNLQPK